MDAAADWCREIAMRRGYTMKNNERCIKNSKNKTRIHNQWLENQISTEISLEKRDHEEWKSGKFWFPDKTFRNVD